MDGTPLVLTGATELVSGNRVVTVNHIFHSKSIPKIITHYCSHIRRPSVNHTTLTHEALSNLVVFRSDEKIGYGIVWELQNDDRSLDAHDRLSLTPIKIFIDQK